MCKPRIDWDVSIAYCYSSSGDDVDCLGRMLRCDWLVFSSCDWCISMLAVSVCCSLSGPLSQGSLVFVSWSWVSMLPEFLFHYPCWCSQGKILSESRLWPCICTNEIRIHKLYFLPKGAVSADFCLFLSGGGLGTGKLDVSLMFFDSVLHRSSGLADLDWTAFTGNPGNQELL